jgi:dihydropyrimidinase
MPDTAYDLVIRNALFAGSAGSVEADLAVTGERIAAIGHGLGAGKREIDARGRIVTPGGVDTHAHIEQLSGGGVMNADTWESATVSAAHGGTTSVIAFAAQHVGKDMRQVVDDYAALARKGAVIDYNYHLIVSDPTQKTLEQDLPALIAEGHASIKAFMTYDAVRLHDEQMLDLMAVARENGAMICVHAENHGMIAWMAKRLVDRGYTAPKYHAISHPRASEPEAFERLIAMSALLDQPIMIFHVSTREGAAVIRRARGEGIKVFAETCPQYLFFTKEALDKPGMEGAKWMFSPPPREVEDQEALWRSLELGDLLTISSDHAPYAPDETGKFMAGPNANFKQIANGLPGLQLRMPLLFDAMVSKGRLGLSRFVALTATQPAAHYNLPNKGDLVIGMDADLVIWDPNKRVTLSDDLVLDRTGYTPYAGMEVTGWPERVFLRGKPLVEDGKLAAAPGSGRFLARKAGPAAEPTGKLPMELDPARNFGAKLL